MRTRALIGAGVWLVAACSQRAIGQEVYQPAPENHAARLWFQDAKVGMFIHWGISSLLMDGEWVMQNRGIRIAEYERIAPLFYPVRFNPVEWVSLARAAGMRYLTLVTKHHDGFALFDSRVTDWDIVDRTSFKRDIVRELADECRRQGLRFFVYYSQLDWHHPDYFPRGQTGQHAGRPDSGRFERYLDFMDAQLRELFTNYGSLGGVWFDGMWDRPDADWRLERTYRMIHDLQPQALIIPNHHRPPLQGEDVQTFEKDLPGGNTAGFNTTTVSMALPLETSETINGSWGFRLNDRQYKSTAQLVRLLVNAAGRNANLLLNIGPMPDGSIQPEFTERLREVGAWLRRYGESIYGTRGGPFAPDAWGVSTQKGDRIYLHILDWKSSFLALPTLSPRVRVAQLMRDGRQIEFRQDRFGLQLKLPDDLDEAVEVVVLELAR